MNILAGRNENPTLKDNWDDAEGYYRKSMGTVRIRHSQHEFATQRSHSVDRAGWQAKMASIETWMPWRNAHKPHCSTSTFFHGHQSLGFHGNRDALLKQFFTTTAIMQLA